MWRKCAEGDLNLLKKVKKFKKNKKNKKENKKNPHPQNKHADICSLPSCTQQQLFIPSAVTCCLQHLT